MARAGHAAAVEARRLRLLRAIGDAWGWVTSVEAATRLDRPDETSRSIARALVNLHRLGLVERRLRGKTFEYRLTPAGAEALAAADGVTD